MSTPTAIEIVREHQRWRRAQGQYAGLCQCPHTPEEIGLALDSVLRDAERFQALERAFEKHNSEGAISVMRWKGKCVWHYTKEPDIDGATLAELADRLKGGT